MRAAELVRRYGIAREVKTPDECVALEPALTARRDWIVGGTYTATDESGDAHKFTRALAALGAERGIEFRYGVTIESIAVADGAVRGVRAVNEGNRKEVLAADAYVACLASYTPKFLDPIGVRTLIYPAKGYSATLPIVAPERAPKVSLTDDAKKLVFTRLGDRLRVAGTAELAGYDLALDPVRCEALTRRSVEWFGDAVDAKRVEYWAGLRPATPSNVPYIGRTRYPNLYLNAGHGTLGWTMAAGSGKALAQIVSGRADDLDSALR
jgi:D-amino-acid dehydrogenase